MTSQPLTFAGGSWTCTWCAAPLASRGLIDHKGDCHWIAEITASPAVAGETFTKAELAAAVDAAMAETRRQSASRISDLEAALGDVLAEFTADDLLGQVRSRWVRVERIGAWRAVQRGDR